METYNDTITITIDRNDEIYDILHDCGAEEDMKLMITHSLNLHQSCMGDGRILSFPTPKRFGQELIGTSEEFLNNIRKAYLNELFQELSESDLDYLLYKGDKDLNAKEVKVASDGHISRVALYYSYIKEIDNRLKSLNNNNEKK